MAGEKFCLRWNDFESNISVAFRELREDKDFFDVTLACDEEQIQAHKVILAACSPFFRGVLKRNPHAHPLLYLKGVKFADLVAVLSFMYHGEVNVAQEDLNSFLAVAEELKVKGLTQGDQQTSKPPHSAPAPRPPAAPRPPDHIPAKRPRPAAPREERPEAQEVAALAGHVKSEPASQAITPLVEMGYEEEAYEEYGAEYGQEGGQGYDAGVLGGGADGNKGFDPSLVTCYEDLLQYVVRTETGYQCICGSFSHRWKMNVQNHLESIHFPGHFSWSCDQCGEQVKTRNGLSQHKSKFHPKNKPQF